MKRAEKINDELTNSIAGFQKSLERFKSMPGYPGVNLGEITEIDIPRYQRGLMGEYESNPVLYDAIQGIQSIEESLEKLGQVNRGIRKILPWRKNKRHNERLKQLGELVDEPHHLRTSGIFTPDNLITTGAEATAIAFGGCYCYLILRYLLGPNPDVSPEEFQQTMDLYKVVIPTLTSVMIGSFWGIDKQFR